MTLQTFAHQWWHYCCHREHISDKYIEATRSLLLINWGEHTQANKHKDKHTSTNSDTETPMLVYFGMFSVGISKTAHTRHMYTVHTHTCTDTHLYGIVVETSMMSRLWARRPATRLVPVWYIKMNTIFLKTCSRIGIKFLCFHSLGVAARHAFLVPPALTVWIKWS